MLAFVAVWFWYASTVVILTSAWAIGARKAHGQRVGIGHRYAGGNGGYTHVGFRHHRPRYHRHVGRRQHRPHYRAFQRYDISEEAYRALATIAGGDVTADY